MSREPTLLAYFILSVLPASEVAAAAEFREKPENPDAARAFDFLLDTDFSKQCDLSTSPLEENLSQLFERSYMGLEFERWEVAERGDGAYLLTLHYIDGRSGPTTARWEVRPGPEEARWEGESAEVLSCF
ncbi:hypothetical protein AN478_09075 [Thiohalorhabdus denitrificans]|uniref:Uncharacterized protein n=1 Tax=Thiohalorhabdus denitrificans TaxID=381306 RepID=A0A0N8PN14_9GAMM|nr:hypothetical protein [Thiohalorhabdus denitrificans]KPV40253.1 hypothetical protein AN478_09075 [Thiohalorhabdus denitrificans]SCX82669.1 hypothetical protein SAMN05661077_0588 [Thiohalorhabdus denitrificans]